MIPTLAFPFPLNFWISYSDDQSNKFPHSCFSLKDAPSIHHSLWSRPSWRGKFKYLIKVTCFVLLTCHNIIQNSFSFPPSSMMCHTVPCFIDKCWVELISNSKFITRGMCQHHRWGGLANGWWDVMYRWCVTPHVAMCSSRSQPLIPLSLNHLQRVSWVEA